MFVFNTDLDNTLIYSYKRDIGTDKISVEENNDKIISYMSLRTYELLKQVESSVLFVPTTTRSVEQYRRIDFKAAVPKYSLVCNGGVLLVDSIKDEEWYRKSLEFAVPAERDILYAQRLLENDKRRIFELRYIEELFLFTKCEEAENVMSDLKQVLNMDNVDVFNKGCKIYIIPKRLDKGSSVIRFKEYIGAEKTIAAGDSDIDISMLNAADIAFAPKEMIGNTMLRDNVVFMRGKSLYSEEMLECILNNCMLSLI